MLIVGSIVVLIQALHKKIRSELQRWGLGHETNKIEENFGRIAIVDKTKAKSMAGKLWYLFIDESQQFYVRVVSESPNLGPSF
jgi:hypothetical protein